MGKNTHGVKKRTSLSSNYIDLFDRFPFGARLVFCSNSRETSTIRPSGLVAEYLYLVVDSLGQQLSPGFS